MTDKIPRIDQIKILLNMIKPNMTRVLPPGPLTADRLAEMTLAYFMRDGELQTCVDWSIQDAAMDLAQLGMVPDGILQHAYIVGRKSKHHADKIAKVQIGYRGFIELAMRSGHVAIANCREVHKNDLFEYDLGTNGFVHHVRELQTPGPVVAAYAFAKTIHGGNFVDVMSVDEIERIRQDGPNPNSAPWKNHYGEMCRKPPLRRLCKYIPMAAAANYWATKDEHNEAGPADQKTPEPVEILGRSNDH